MHSHTLKFPSTSMWWIQAKDFWHLIIQKSWHFTELIKAHDKLGHKGVNRTYHLTNINITGRAWKRTSTNASTILHCVKGKSKVTCISPSDDWYTWQTFWQNRHRPGIRSQCLWMRKSIHTDYHWLLNRIARSFSHPWQEGRYHFLCLHQ